MDHLEFLNFAKSTVLNAKSEFEYRNIASRAYYYALHCCLLNKIGRSIPIENTFGSHDKVYKAIEDLPGVDGDFGILKSMVYVAKMMKLERKHADYVLSEPFTFEQAKRQVVDATTIHRHFRSLSN